MCGFSKCFPAFAKLQLFTDLAVGKIVQYKQEKTRCCDDQSRGYPLRYSRVLHSGTVCLNQVVYICLDSM